jgi:hypothetical protein
LTKYTLLVVQGIQLTVIRDFFGMALYFAGFHLTKDYLTKSWNKREEGDSSAPTPAELMISGAGCIPFFCLSPPLIKKSFLQWPELVFGL